MLYVLLFRSLHLRSRSELVVGSAGTHRGKGRERGSDTEAHDILVSR